MSLSQPTTVPQEIKPLRLLSVSEFLGELDGFDSRHLESLMSLKTSADEYVIPRLVLPDITLIDATAIDRIRDYMCKVQNTELSNKDITCYGKFAQVSTKDTIHKTQCTKAEKDNKKEDVLEHQAKQKIKTLIQNNSLGVLQTKKAAVSCSQVLDLTVQNNDKCTQIVNEETENLSILEQLKLANTIKLNKTKAIHGCKGLYVRRNKSSIVIMLRADKNDEFFKILTFDSDHDFTENCETTICKAHKRFLDLRDAKMSWKNLEFLLEGSYREIRTFRELLEYHMETGSPDVIHKTNRFLKRYFAGQWGAKIIKNYCVGSFTKDFLDRNVPAKQKSDRNEVIKMINSALNKARDDLTVRMESTLKIPNKLRSHADKSDKITPELSTFVKILETAYLKGDQQLVLALMIELTANTRKGITESLRWEKVNLQDKFIEIPCNEAKSGFVRHPIASKLAYVLMTELRDQYCDKTLLNRDSKGKPVFVFESKSKKGVYTTTLLNRFNKVKEIVIQKAKQNGADDYQITEIQAFHQHRIRDIVEDYLMKIHASEAQKEKCLGRKPRETGSSYARLDLPTLTTLKDEMVSKIEQEFPVFKEILKSMMPENMHTVDEE